MWARIVFSALEGGPDVREARTFVRDCAAACLGNSSPLVDDMETMASEVLTNAVRYTASGQANGSIAVLVQASAGRLRVTVRDDGHATTLPRVGPVHLEAGSGRGLLIVEALSNDWGVEIGPEPQRPVTVWFEVAK
ncbi:ATP-binding protein [Actinomadura hibisca]|uniref:ATP-binding protein n=1 Tax=Actinomadura hibisca TaxID=68565 RepID=UPI001471A4BB|nr:ATP-binding protein [Actinomadura hibisca]